MTDTTRENLVQQFFSRILELSLASIACIILAPVFLLLFAAVRLTGKGAAIFRQQRAGKDGKPFVSYKFRTMKIDVDPFGPSPKSVRRPSVDKNWKTLMIVFI